MPLPSKPTLLKGNLSVDDRGVLSFINDFKFEGVKRAYTTQNHQVNFVRAWHAHQKEAKYVTAVTGSALVCIVKIDDWEHPFAPYKFSGERFVLSTAAPSILYIPPGYANGWKSLTGDCKLMWFSTATVEESREDDFRWAAEYWNPWHVKER
jgi:dTDP-4-dehydrorhamnose 3,5-epimerase-like enzyme